jgi:single-strand DNA-binding protein
MINKVILVGNLGADPELKSVGGGTSQCRLSVATNERWRDKQTGEKKEKTTWHRVVIWGKNGENAAQILGKGATVYIEGKINNYSWEDKQTGEKKYGTDINAHIWQMVKPGKDARQPGEDGPMGPTGDGAQASFDDGFASSGGADEVPF